MKYDLIVIGAGPSGMMTARTASRDGLKVLLVEKKPDARKITRLCTQLLKLGPGGFSSDKVPTDKIIRPVQVTFETDFDRSTLHLSNLPEPVDVRYLGSLRMYHNEVWISPSGNYYSTLPSNENIYGYCIDKEALLAGLQEDAIAAGTELRTGTKCVDLADNASGITATLSSKAGTETLTAKRAVLADGSFSPIMDKLGFNEGRDMGPAPLKFIMYRLDRIDSPFPESRFLKLCAPDIHRGQISLGLYAHETYQLEISVPIGVPANLPALLDKIMKESPFAAYFANSRIVGRFACNMALSVNIFNPARGNVICCGDNAAYAETAIKGALGCGFVAGKAVRKSLEGGDGNKLYNDYWDQAFYSHSPQYRTFGRRVLPAASRLNNSEINRLYQWIADRKLHGMLNDIIPDHIEEVKTDMPEVAEKLVIPKPAN